MQWLCAGQEKGCVDPQVVEWLRSVFSCGRVPAAEFAARFGDIDTLLTQPWCSARLPQGARRMTRQFQDETRERRSGQHIRDLASALGIAMEQLGDWPASSPAQTCGHASERTAAHAGLPEEEEEVEEGPEWEDDAASDASSDDTVVLTTAAVVAAAAEQEGVARPMLRPAEASASAASSSQEEPHSDAVAGSAVVLSERAATAPAPPSHPVCAADEGNGAAGADAVRSCGGDIRAGVEAGQHAVAGRTAEEAGDPVTASRLQVGSWLPLPWWKLGSPRFRG